MLSLGLPFQLVLNAVLETFHTVEKILSGRYFTQDGSTYWDKLWSSLVTTPAMIEPPTPQTFTQTITRLSYSTLTTTTAPAPATVTVMPSSIHEILREHQSQNLRTEPVAEYIRDLGMAFIPWVILVWILVEVYRSLRTTTRVPQTIQPPSVPATPFQAVRTRSAADRTLAPRNIPAQAAPTRSVATQTTSTEPEDVSAPAASSKKSTLSTYTNTILLDDFRPASSLWDEAAAEYGITETSLKDDILKLRDWVKDLVVQIDDLKTLIQKSNKDKPPFWRRTNDPDTPLVAFKPIQAIPSPVEQAEDAVRTTTPSPPPPTIPSPVEQAEDAVPTATPSPPPPTIPSPVEQAEDAVPTATPSPPPPPPPIPTSPKLSEERAGDEVSEIPAQESMPSPPPPPPIPASPKISEEPASDEVLEIPAEESMPTSPPQDPTLITPEISDETPVLENPETPVETSIPSPTPHHAPSADLSQEIPDLPSPVEEAPFDSMVPSPLAPNASVASPIPQEQSEEETAVKQPLQAPEDTTLPSPQPSNVPEEQMGWDEVDEELFGPEDGNDEEEMEVEQSVTIVLPQEVDDNSGPTLAMDTDLPEEDAQMEEPEAAVAVSPPEDAPMNSPPPASPPPPSQLPGLGSVQFGANMPPPPPVVFQPPTQQTSPVFGPQPTMSIYDFDTAQIGRILEQAKAIESLGSQSQPAQQAWPIQFPIAPQAQPAVSRLIKTPTSRKQKAEMRAIEALVSQSQASQAPAIQAPVAQAQPAAQPAPPTTSPIFTYTPAPSRLIKAPKSQKQVAEARARVAVRVELRRPGCNLNGCYIRAAHTHSDEDEERLGSDGCFLCRFCDSLGEHECWDKGELGWTWDCFSEGCEIKYKHEHPEDREVWDDDVAQGSSEQQQQEQQQPQSQAAAVDEDLLREYDHDDEDDSELSSLSYFSSEDEDEMDNSEDERAEERAERSHRLYLRDPASFSPHASVGDTDAEDEDEDEDEDEEEDEAGEGEEEADGMGEVSMLDPEEACQFLQEARLARANA